MLQGTDMEALCKYAIHGTSNIKMEYFVCKTCNMGGHGGKGVCAACAWRCHWGHKLKKQKGR